MRNPWGVLSRLIEDERRRRDLSRSDLACMVGIDPATLQRVLSAEPVRVSTIHVLASGLGLEWEQVVSAMAGETRHHCQRTSPAPLPDLAPISRQLPPETAEADVGTQMGCRPPQPGVIDATNPAGR